MTTEKAFEHLGNHLFEFAQHDQRWYPPSNHIISREDWAAIKTLRDHYGTGLLGNFAYVGIC